MRGVDRMRLALAAMAGVALLVGCGDDASSSATATRPLPGVVFTTDDRSTSLADRPPGRLDEDDPPTSVSNRADAYAYKVSDGVRLGCSDAASGADAEANPGCIYSAAFAGCVAGIEGEDAGDTDLTEPGLLRIARDAAQDCAA